MRERKVRVSRRPFDTKRHGFELHPESALAPRTPDLRLAPDCDRIRRRGSQLMPVPRDRVVTSRDAAGILTRVAVGFPLFWGVWKTLENAMKLVK
jgi:hypothetical protein